MKSIKSLISMAALSVAAACGGNPCNSELYEKHLWEIAECRNGLYFRDDCKVGIALGGDKEYDFNNGKFVNTTYEGLTMEFERSGKFTFDPELRFTHEAHKDYKTINRILDNRQSYVLKVDGVCDQDNLKENCLYIVEDRIHPGSTICKGKYGLDRK